LRFFIPSRHCFEAMIVVPGLQAYCVATSLMEEAR
jgi:hypothetical protein